MGISDLVTQRILQLLHEQDGSAEIRRNELAETLGCVPSQINYVITSRFTPEHGYNVESRRGGGGYIRITRVRMDRGSVVMHLVNSIGREMDHPTARAIIGNLQEQNVILPQTAAVMEAAMRDRCFSGFPVEVRDALRANILKQMLINAL
ncbi:MAG: CtsR family transcriptional regulator [Clostridia bacterium]|nr:CtsR family transcriptional regulator [Clostridia bacterium]